ncbi:hypothetical protein KJ652_01720 [Patescibacteria group bacterium]|nr:hypothetical protein [Patescibacteria group bacterium]MBU1123282.1 hypothetical protein [Patescibacteria group bacterium]MBU1910865.1 hypothetical protein [Patescibacteria group bacterium]
MESKREIAQAVSLIEQGCNVYCCRHGSPYVLPNERDRILEIVGKDVFVIEGNHFIIGKNNDRSMRDMKHDPCPFLNGEELCSLQTIDPILKPADCYMHPIFPWYKNGREKLGVTRCCEACDHLSSEFVGKVRALIHSIPIEHRKGLAHHQEKYGFPLSVLKLSSSE